MLKLYSSEELLKLVITNMGFTVHLFKNKDYVQNMRKSNSYLNLKINGRLLKVYDIGDAEFNTVWYSIQSIVNVYNHSLFVRYGC